MPSGIRMYERHRYYTDLLNTTSQVKIRYAQYIFNQHLTITDKKHLIQICDEAYYAMENFQWSLELDYEISFELFNLLELLGYKVDSYKNRTVIELM